MQKEIDEQDTRDQLQVMAAAIYEIRSLLSSCLGSQNTAKTSVRLAAHLSYALHNEAEKILEGKGNINLQDTLARVKVAEDIVGFQFVDGYGVLGVGKDS